MKILVVCQYFWPESFRINDVCEGLIKKGHDITVLTGIPNYPEGKFFNGYGYFKKYIKNYKGINIIRVPLIPRMKGKGWQLLLNYISFALFACIISPFLCRYKFDLIYVYQLSPITMALPAILLKKIKKIPVILYVLDLWPESLSATGAVKSRFILNLTAKLVKFIYKNCDRITVSSFGFISQIVSVGIDKSKIFYWPQWAEELYKVVELEKGSPEVDEIPQGFRIMFAGNIGAAQSFETIISAAEKIKDNSEIHWIILGDGRVKSWVEDQIILRGLSSNVHLLGRRPVETMPRYFALADAMLVTLKKDPIFALTLPAKVQSYLACGKPVIAAIDGEGARVVEESGIGVTCEAEDADALAGIVLKFFNLSKEERDAMGIRARQYFDNNFKREMLLDQLEDWFKEYWGYKCKDKISG